MDPAAAAAIADRYPRISDKIRALHAAGCSRGEIARLLKRSPQQVRQVLALDEARRTRQAQALGGGEREQAAFDHAGVEPSRTYRLAIQTDGSIRLPAHLERDMGLRRGGVVIAEFAGDRLVLLSTATALRQAQDMVKAAVPAAVRLVDELIADRRREAAREDGDD